MNEEISLTELTSNAPARRLWLLYKAANALPFDHAIELARTTEAFVTGASITATPLHYNPAVEAADGRQANDHWQMATAADSTRRPRKLSETAR